jgi:DNA-binding response OmpR family regulator
MQALRAQGRTTPVLMLTARDGEDDVIRGFDMGADDYLTKPFSFAELVALLQSITRHHRPKQDGTIESDGGVLDPIRHSVTLNMRNEFLLRVCLVRRAGQCVVRKALMEFVWGRIMP